MIFRADTPCLAIFSAPGSTPRRWPACRMLQVSLPTETYTNYTAQLQQHQAQQQQAHQQLALLQQQQQAILQLQRLQQLQALQQQLSLQQQQQQMMNTSSGNTTSSMQLDPLTSLTLMQEQQQPGSGGGVDVPLSSALQTASTAMNIATMHTPAIPQLSIAPLTHPSIVTTEQPMSSGRVGVEGGPGLVQTPAQQLQGLIGLTAAGGGLSLSSPITAVQMLQQQFHQAEPQRAVAPVVTVQELASPQQATSTGAVAEETGLGKRKSSRTESGKSEGEGRALTEYQEFMR